MFFLFSQSSLQHFATKLKGTFAALKHTHSVSDITDLLLGVRNLFPYNEFIAKAQYGLTNNGSISIDKSRFAFTLMATGNDCYTGTYNSFAGSSTTEVNGGRTVFIPIEAGQQYLFSFRHEAADGVEGIFFVFFYKDNGDNTTYSTLKNFTHSGSGIARFTITADAKYPYVGVRFGVSKAGNTIRFSEISVRKCVNQVDWIPAHEDLTRDIEAVQTTAIEIKGAAAAAQSTADTATGTANEANQRSKDNLTRLDTVQGVANEANERSKINQSRLDSLQGTAYATKATAENNTTRLDSVQGTANAAKALAESNQKLLSTVEGTANSGKALAEECRKLIDTNAGNIAMVSTPAHVQLMCLNQQLYVIADEGYIQGTDEVVLFRYVRSHNRYRASDSHRRTIGWKEPLKGKDRISLRLLGIETNAEGKEQYLIGTKRNLNINGIIDIFTSYDTSLDETDKSTRFYLFNKKCGIRIMRDGVWITDYLPFMARRVKQNNDYTYGVGRWMR